MDNIGKLNSSELKKMLLADAQVKKDEPKKTEEQSPKTEAKAEAKETPKTEELILGKFKSTDDLVKAYQESERKITELSQEVKKVESPKPASQAGGDDLWNLLFGGTQEKTVSKPIVEEDNIEDQRVANLEKEVANLRKAGAYLVQSQQAVTNKQKAVEKLKNDPVLPYDDTVDKELESVFARYPSLRYAVGGYEVAHTILKGEKATEISQRKVDEAVKAIHAKKESNSAAVVETPAKSSPEPEVDPLSLDMKKLRAHLKKNLGELERN